MPYNIQLMWSMNISSRHDLIPQSLNNIDIYRTYSIVNFPFTFMCFYICFLLEMVEVLSEH